MSQMRKLKIRMTALVSRDLVLDLKSKLLIHTVIVDTIEFQLRILTKYLIRAASIFSR